MVVGCCFLLVFSQYMALRHIRKTSKHIQLCAQMPVYVFVQWILCGVRIGSARYLLDLFNTHKFIIQLAENCINVQTICTKGNNTSGSERKQPNQPEIDRSEMCVVAEHTLRVSMHIHRCALVQMRSVCFRICRRIVLPK